MRVEFIIAGVSFVLEVDGLGEGPREHLLDQKLKPFIVHHPRTEPSIVVRATVKPGSGPFAGHDPEVRRDQFGLVSFAHRTSLLERQKRAPEADHYSLIFGFDDARPIENALRILTSERLRAAGSGLFHAAAIAYQGRGWLFPGVSGAGKTTLSLRAGRPLVLSDEMPAVIRASNDATGEEWRVAATPFFGDMGHGERGDTLPLAGVCLLGEKGVSFVRAAAPGEGLQGLLATEVLYGPDSASQREAARIAERLAQRVPMWVLATEREEPFDRVMERVHRVALAS